MSLEDEKYPALPPMDPNVKPMFPELDIYAWRINGES